MSYFEDLKKQNPERFIGMSKEQEQRAETMINSFGAFMGEFWGINDGGCDGSIDRKDFENV